MSRETLPGLNADQSTVLQAFYRALGREVHELTRLDDHGSMNLSQGWSGAGE